MNSKCKLLLVLQLIMVVTAVSFSPAKSDQIDIKLNLEPGKKHRMQVVSEQNIGVTAHGMQRDMHNVSTMEIDFDILAVEDGNTTIAVTIQRIIDSRETPAGKMVFDTASPPENTDMHFNLLASLIGASYTVVVDPRGHAVEVRGVDEMVAEAINRMEDSGNATDMAKQLLQRMWGDKTSRHMLGQFFGMIPPGPTAVGDSWETDLELAGMMEVSGRNDCTLEELDNGKAVVDVEAEFITINEDDGKQTEYSAIQRKISGTRQGRIELDMVTGMLIGGEIVLNASGTQILPPRGGQTEGEEMPVTMEIKSTIEAL